MTGASLALNLSRPEKALEIMEQGCATFWTHTLRLRSPFYEIPRELRDRLSRIARRLEKVASPSEHSTDQRHVEMEIARRRKESEELSSLVDQVRCLPGHERFMLPDEYSTLKGVTEKGPVVVLVCSTLACHAMILTQSGIVSSMPPEAITDKWLVESASEWRSTVIEARSAMRDGRKIIKIKKTLDSSRTRAERILHLLWINVVFPVIQALRIEVRLRFFISSIETHLIVCSHRLGEIVLAYGGVQLDPLHICLSMLQVLTAHGAQITSYHPILPRSAAYLAQERSTHR
jgi:hypothetical protein